MIREAAVALVGSASGVALGWVFCRTADLAALERVWSRIVAHLLEFRLFFDEPALILRAQGELIRENGRLIRAVALPALAAGLPFALLLTLLEPVFGVGPLRVGESAIVSASLPGQAVADDTPATLEAPAGIRVDAGPVRIPAEQRVCWRIVALRQAEGALRVNVGGRSAERPVAAGERPLVLRACQNCVRVEYPETPWMTAFLLWSAAAAGGSAWRITSRS